jgi:hypothetical protein
LAAEGKFEAANHGGNTIGPHLVHGEEERTLIGIAVPTNRRTAAHWKDADASQMLNAVQGPPEVHVLLNVEDEVYIAAALGLHHGNPAFSLVRTSA